MDFTATTPIKINGAGPDDLAADERGRLYTGIEDGRIIRIADNGRAIETVAECPDRPYGVEIVGQDKLVVCAGRAGLLEVQLGTGAIRTLADKVLDAPMRACYNAAVAADGTVYFSDMSRRFGVHEWRRDMIEETGTARLLRRNADGTVDVLLSGLHTAAGVALAPDESFVVVSDLGRCRVRRVWLTGERQGADDVFADGLDGYPNCATLGSDGLIWVSLAAPRHTLLAAVNRLPRVMKTLVGRVPEGLQPGPADRVAAIGFDTSGAIVRSYSGVLGGLGGILTGLCEHGGMLYLSSMDGSAVVSMPMTAGSRSEGGHGQHARRSARR